MQRVIGIDFGTSTTYMNVKRYDGDRPVEDQFSYMPVVFNYGQSSGFVASIVRENADGTFDFGENASEQLEGAKIYSEIKMLLESPDEAQRSEARRVFQEFFKFLRETYAQQSANLGAADDTEETILSYPVKWKEETVQFMLEAARAAGFQNVHGMDEATAAVSAVLCSNASSNLICAGKPGYLMLVDMGAGTTDLVVCKYWAEGQGDIRVELVTSWPQDADEPTFGGREIDAVLEQYVEEYLTKALTPALVPNAHAFASAPGQAKMWKERNVSVNLAANKSINTCAYIGVYRNTGVLKGEFPAFGRKEFEQIAASGLNDYVRLLKGCLDHTAEKDPQFAADGLDLVILTGGHSAWYFAREIVDGTMAGYLDHPSLKNIRDQKARVVNLANPQTTVSLGLVYSKLPFTSTRPKLEPKSEPKPQPKPQPKPEPKPDSQRSDAVDPRRVPEIVRDAVANDPEFYETNHLADSNLVFRMRTSLQVPASAEILYVYAERDAENAGYVLADTGIYQKRLIGLDLGYSVTFFSWEDFILSDTVGNVYGAFGSYSYGDKKLAFSKKPDTLL